MFPKDILWKNIVVLQGTNPNIYHGYINPSFSQLSSNQTPIKKNALKYIQRRSTPALINHIVKIALGLLSTKGNISGSYQITLMTEGVRLDNSSFKIDFNNWCPSTFSFALDHQWYHVLLSENKSKNISVNIAKQKYIF